MRNRTFQRGAALVEFALVSSLLFLLLFGILEVGLLLGDQAQVAQAARAAVRSAAVGSTVEAAQGAAVSAGTGLSLTAGSILVGKERRRRHKLGGPGRCGGRHQQRRVRQPHSGDGFL